MAGAKADDDFITTAQAVAEGTTLETMTRPFLDMLHTLTGLESTYLTEVRADENEQEILYADNRGDIEVPEGLTVSWQDTLCRRALMSGLNYTADVETDLPGSAAAKALGLNTYISVPVRGQNDQLMGTLCGASGESTAVASETLVIMHMLARLISDQWERDNVRVAAVERAETAEARLEERAVFLAEAEHKLKSPITLVKGWSELLAKRWEGLPPETRLTAIETIQRAANDASQQIDEMLEEARSEVLSHQFDLVDVQLDQMLTEIVDQLDGVATNDGHVVVLESNAKAIVRTDRNALWQIFWHLGENALKYSPNGGRISFSSEAVGRNAIITIRDEGIGVPEDIDIFAPFARGQGETMTAIPGTGLGLHIVRNLVRTMRGSVSAERNEDGGSTFRVTLPIT